MKLNYYFSLFLIGAIFVLGACNGNDDDPVGGQAILFNDTSETTGQLIVEVIDENSTRVNGARVSLYATFEDFQNDVWLYDIRNNNSNVFNFGYVNIGNYYIYAVDESSGRRNSGDAAQVRSQKTTNRLVVIRPQ